MADFRVMLITGTRKGIGEKLVKHYAGLKLRSRSAVPDLGIERRSVRAHGDK